MSLNQCLGSTERGGWRGVGRKGLAKGWRKVGEGLAKGWQRVGGFPCTLQFRNSRGTRLETLVCDSMEICWRLANLRNRTRWKCGITRAKSTEVQQKEKLWGRRSQIASLQSQSQIPEISYDFDTEYDRAKVPPYNGNDPRPPLVV